MKIKELIQELKTYNQDMQVFFSSDEEGNSFHPKAQISLTKSLYKSDEEKLAVVIYPLNTDNVIT